MKKRKYVSNWMSNTSVAAVIVGGFQQMDLWLHIFALCIAILFFAIGYILHEGD